MAEEKGLKKKPYEATPTKTKFSREACIHYLAGLTVLSGVVYVYSAGNGHEIYEKLSAGCTAGLAYLTYAQFRRKH